MLHEAIRQLNNILFEQLYFVVAKAELKARF